MPESSKQHNDSFYQSQFSLEPEYYRGNTDFLNWFRYFYLLKDAQSLNAGDVLEVGVGDGMLRSCLKPLVRNYKVLDINEKLQPDYVGDIRDRSKELASAFDLVIAADVLEHIPFSNLAQALGNLRSYLRPGAHALITIPHRRSNFLFMSPTNVPHVLTVPTGFLSPGAFYRRFLKRKIWIDPHHCWEIGDGNVKRSTVEDSIRSAGFSIFRFKKLLYVDYWILRSA